MGRRIRYRPNRLQEPLPSLGQTQGGTFWTPKTIFTIAIIWVVALVAIVLVGYLLMQNRKFEQEFTLLIDVCRGKRVNVASTYAPAPGNHPAIAVRRNSGELQLDTHLIPWPAVAQTLAETQIVLCMGPVQEVFIESCPYTTKGNSEVTNSVERYYLKQEAKLLEAKTGRLIAVQSFTGKSPDYCEQTQIFTKGERVIRSVGTEVSDSDVAKWAQDYLVLK